MCRAHARRAARTPWTPGSPTRPCAATTAPTRSTGHQGPPRSLTVTPLLTSVLNARKFAPFSYRLIPSLRLRVPISSAPFWQVGLSTLQRCGSVHALRPAAWSAPGAATRHRKPAVSPVPRPLPPASTAACVGLGHLCAYRPFGPPSLGRCSPLGRSALGARGLRGSVCVQAGLFQATMSVAHADLTLRLVGHLQKESGGGGGGCRPANTAV